MKNENMKNENMKTEITPVIIQSHIDVITSLHYAIADNPENRKKLEDYVCNVCCKIGCTGRGRCKTTSLTMAQINLLTGLVTIRDEGSMELGIGGYDRVITIGEALKPFNPILADYFKEEGKEMLHTILCLAKSKGTSLGKLNIPTEYNVKTDKLLNI
jgi:hypothetical protein